MKTSRLLYLSAHQMTAYRWQSGELTGEGFFTATADGQQQFADYLAQHSSSIFSILANVSEEGFQIETIPFLRGADRQAIISRKLGQLFFNAALTASLSLGHEKTKRKDERVMLAALTNKDFFDPWLQAIANAGVALSGIYSLPLLAPSLLRKLSIAGDQCLLLTVQDQSIRQSYFEKGELHFSRLTPLHNSSIAGIAQTFSAEAQKLQQYLSSQRMIARNQLITVHILAHTTALKAIQSSCTDTATIHYNVLNIEDCAQKTGLKTAPPDSHCEQLFLNLLVTAPPRIQFADDVQRHDHHLLQIRSALHGLGALALLGCLLFSGTLLFETYTVTQQTATLRSEADQARLRYNDIAKTFPPIPTDNDTLRRIIDRYIALEKKSASPDGLYHEISRALHAAPAVELDSIDWQLGSSEAGTARGAGQATAATPVASDSEAVIVRGTLTLGPNSNARQMLSAFNVLLEALKANPKLQVVVLQRPLDIESGKSLKGGDTTVEDNKPRTFSVQVIRKFGS
ncbi:hypothetical protein [Propionivibrio sp.]|uniref:hypothetical protein n=1 Tax=Propionivibrio sp. TaxID=2212460 RepID=UPI00261D0B36|nr:hypothetical protein [Propionivibrio sp.]